MSRSTSLRRSLAVVLGVGVLLTAPQVIAQPYPSSLPPAVPALPPCDAFSPPRAGAISVVIPPLPGRNCLPAHTRVGPGHERVLAVSRAAADR